jgi:hypothetical protein
MSITLVFRRKCIYICTRLEYIHPTDFCEASLGPDALKSYGTRILYFVSVNIKRQVTPHDFSLLQIRLYFRA